ncbi:hypothetical protein RF55_16045 [Lasius niger]|uniref:Uncharacterized protein n=1 Tax=Lasius niger TaxID=67767 RepID=A0A0J7K516_LASNI|nr:hypothetical protein RF55_16045 [Lasius niger]
MGEIWKKLEERAEKERRKREKRERERAERERKAEQVRRERRRRNLIWRGIEGDSPDEISRLMIRLRKELGKKGEGKRSGGEDRGRRKGDSAGNNGERRRQGRVTREEWRDKEEVRDHRG